jgi:hypothetical protein
MTAENLGSPLMYSAVEAYTKVWYATSAFDPVNDGEEVLLADLQAHPGGFGALASAALNSRADEQTRRLNQLRQATTRSMNALDRLVQGWPHLDVAPDDVQDAHRALVALYIRTTLLRDTRQQAA